MTNRETNRQNQEQSIVSLFAGIGGFEIGFEEAGFRVVAQCEIDPYCRGILAEHWPDVPRLEDVRTVNGADLPPASVWTAGFPCQDVSVARGHRKEGINGRSSALFFEFARLVREGRPRVFILENVPGLLNSHAGRDFGIVLSSLAQLGYALGWRVLNSRYFGVPQSRQRVYIVGCHRDWRGPLSILFEPERGTRHAKKGKGDEAPTVSPFKKVVGDPSGKGPVTPALAYCLYAESARHTGTDWSRNYVSYPSRGDVRRLTPNEAEMVMGFPHNWTVPKSFEGKPEDLDSWRYHALGNAVTPPVAQWLGHRVKPYLESKQSQIETTSEASVQSVSGA